MKTVAVVAMQSVDEDSNILNKTSSGYPQVYGVAGS
jgi:hypothetical protein